MSICPAFLLKRSDDPANLHFFGGANTVEDANCPGCRKPLLTFLTIHTRDHALYFRSAPWSKLVLFHCPRCNIFGSGFSYQLTDQNRLVVLEAEVSPEKGLGDDWRNEFGEGPLPKTPCRLYPLPKDAQRVIDRINKEEGEPDPKLVTRLAVHTEQYANANVGGYAYLKAVNQFGGRPWLPQGPIFASCPRCKTRILDDDMEFLACITNDRKQGFKFIFDGCYLVYSVCPKCWTISAHNFAT